MLFQDSLVYAHVQSHKRALLSTHTDAADYNAFADDEYDDADHGDDGDDNYISDSHPNCSWITLAEPLSFNDITLLIRCMLLSFFLSQSIGLSHL